MEKYKEDLRKTYTCITLFLFPLDDASDTEPGQHCTSELECLESLSDAWLNNVDLGKDDTDILPAFDIFSVLLSLRQAPQLVLQPVDLLLLHLQVELSAVLLVCVP